MDRFLPHDNKLADHINKCAQELLLKLRSVNVDSLEIPEYCKVYYRGSHASRLFFSIETSAHILYESLQLLNKQPEQVVVMDYGAGVGSLFLLAKMIGCRKVIYNDHLQDWKDSAEKISNSIGVSIDDYVVGDIVETLEQLEARAIKCDLITSRNVVEHIYDLRAFYSAIRNAYPSILVFSSTTANIYNPAARTKHIMLHNKWEDVYAKSRENYIRQKFQFSNEELKGLIASTRGLNYADIDKAVETYSSQGKLPDSSVHRSNTCEPSTGVWAEHLLTFGEYKNLIDAKHYEVSFKPGFWDTHYSKGWKNAGTRLLNRLIRSNQKFAFTLAPFIYVIAKGKTS